jgi:hypothetical protein
MTKPSFVQVWNAFPDHAQYPNMESLYTMLGGQPERNINAPGFGPNGNACASRMSVAFNKGGAPIVAARVPRKERLVAADNSSIIFQVAAFRRYLLATLGRPTLDNASPFDDSFVGKRGIIAYSINFGPGATGHIALWNGAAYREPRYDNYATWVDPDDATKRTQRGEFWELA